MCSINARRCVYFRNLLLNRTKLLKLRIKLATAGWHLSDDEAYEKLEREREEDDKRYAEHVARLKQWRAELLYTLPPPPAIWASRGLRSRASAGCTPRWDLVWGLGGRAAVGV